MRRKSIWGGISKAISCTLVAGLILTSTDLSFLPLVKAEDFGTETTTEGSDLYIADSGEISLESVFAVSEDDGTETAETEAAEPEQETDAEDGRTDAAQEDAPAYISSADAASEKDEDDSAENAAVGKTTTVSSYDELVEALADGTYSTIYIGGDTQNGAEDGIATVGEIDGDTTYNANQTISETLIIKTSVTISAANNASVTLSRGANDIPLIQISGSDVTVTLKNITVDGSTVGNGANYAHAIEVTGGATLTLDNSTVQNNAITISDRSSVTSDTVVSGTTVTGGAIYLDKSSTLTMNSSTVTNNSTTVTDTSIINVYGGGIYVAGGSTATISFNNSNITNNTVAGKPSTSKGMVYGGGICVGAGVSGGRHLISLSNCVVSGNTATVNEYSTKSSGGDLITPTAGGGGIYIATYNYLKVSGCTFENNQVINDQEGIDSETPVNGYGGAIYFDGHGSAGTSETNVTNNYIKNSTFSNNSVTCNKDSSKGRGGAVALGSNAADYILDTTFTGNSASGKTNGYGGALYTQANTTLERITVTGNKATTHGGGVAISGASTAERKVYVYSAEISGNMVINASGTANRGGGICVLDSEVKVYLGTGAKFATGSEFDSASAIDTAATLTETEYDGETYTTDVNIHGNFACRGGGVYVEAGTVTVGTDCAIYENYMARYGLYPGAGGGIYLYDSSATLELNGLVYGNYAVEFSLKNTNYKGSGGGVFVNTGAIFTLKGGIITGNAVTENGGGVYVEDGATANLNSGTIGGILRKDGSGNMADANNAERGAGVYSLGTCNIGAANVDDEMQISSNGTVFSMPDTSNTGYLESTNNQESAQSDTILSCDGDTLDTKSSAFAMTEQTTDSDGAVYTNSYSYSFTVTPTAEDKNANPAFVITLGGSTIATAYANVKTQIGGTFTIRYDHVPEDLTEWYAALADGCTATVTAKYSTNDEDKTILTLTFFCGDKSSENTYVEYTVTINLTDRGYSSDSKVNIRFSGENVTLSYLSVVTTATANEADEYGNTAVTTSTDYVTWTGATIVESVDHICIEGGGVYVAGGETDIYDNAVINLNRAKATGSNESEKGRGGGIYIAAGTVNLQGGTIGGTYLGESETVKTLYGYDADSAADGTSVSIIETVDDAYGDEDEEKKDENTVHTVLEAIIYHKTEDGTTAEAILNSNMACYGAGVYLAGGTFNFSSGSICANIAYTTTSNAKEQGGGLRAL